MRRIDQILANLGYCSRREAKAFLKTHAVTARGGALRDASEKVRAADVLVDGEPLDHPDGLLLMLNKPLGLVCSHDPREGPGIYSLFPPRWLARNPQLTSVGRLDKETSGLILVTDQAALVHRLTSPKHKVPKLYRAIVNRAIPAETAGLFASGALMLDGESGPCAPAELRILDLDTSDAREAELVLTEGRYHQVRRMFASVGCEVTALHREKFGALELGGLEPGKWRELALDYFGAV